MSEKPSTAQAETIRETDENDMMLVERQSLLTQAQFIQNYRGFINVAIILLVLTNVRLIAENMLKYGVLMQFDLLKIHDVTNWPVARLFATYPLYFLAGYLIEKAITIGLPARLFLVLHFINAFAAVTIPSLYIWELQPGPGQSVFAMLTACIVFFKLVSYAVENASARSIARSKKEAKDSAGVLWPNNVTVRDMGYFVLVPVLKYSLNYPRSDRIHRRRVLRQTGEFIFVVLLILVLVEQYILPLCKNALKPFSDMDLGSIVERVLKLAVPNFYVWFLGFFAFFHLYLNIIAELLRFGDRRFYKDWWNATTTNYYWRSWNLPTYHWLLSYVYAPLVRFGLPKTLAGGVVFLVSAFFHELVLSVPFHTIKLWGFLGMALQIPFGLLTRPLEGHQAGNFFFWLTIMIGQPMCVLLYYYDYMARHNIMAH